MCQMPSGIASESPVWILFVCTFRILHSLFRSLKFPVQRVCKCILFIQNFLVIPNLLLFVLPDLFRVIVIAEGF